MARIECPIRASPAFQGIVEGSARVAELPFDGACSRIQVEQHAFRIRADRCERDGVVAHPPNGPRAATVGQRKGAQKQTVFVEDEYAAIRLRLAKINIILVIESESAEPLVAIRAGPPKHMAKLSISGVVGLDWPRHGVAATIVSENAGGTYGKDVPLAVRSCGLAFIRLKAFPLRVILGKLSEDRPLR